MLVISCSLGFVCDLSGFVRHVHERFHSCIGLIKVLLGLFLTNAIFETAYLIEFAHSAAVQFINTPKRFLTECLLVVCQEKASELLSLEKILAVVLMLWHG
jgi:hypothetical protein